MHGFGQSLRILMFWWLLFNDLAACLSSEFVGFGTCFSYRMEDKVPLLT
jgi:hypothetical protein